jgi:hypothetical protein
MLKMVKLGRRHMHGTKMYYAGVPTLELANEILLACRTPPSEMFSGLYW